jgi:hypothetical protein
MSTVVKYVVKLSNDRQNVTLATYLFDKCHFDILSFDNVSFDIFTFDNLDIDIVTYVEPKKRQTNFMYMTLVAYGRIDAIH